MPTFRDVREARGLTVGDLAAEARVQPRIVHLIEDGAIGSVPLHLILCVADALGMGMQERYGMMEAALSEHRAKVRNGLEAHA